MRRPTSSSCCWEGKRRSALGKCFKRDTRGHTRSSSRRRDNEADAQQIAREQSRRSRSVRSSAYGVDCVMPEVAPTDVRPATMVLLLAVLNQQAKRADFKPFFLSFFFPFWNTVINWHLVGRQIWNFPLFQVWQTVDLAKVCYPALPCRFIANPWTRNLCLIDWTLQTFDKTVSCIPANTGTQILKCTKYANKKQLEIHSHFFFCLPNEKLIH